jgi:hypothetical protein
MICIFHKWSKWKRFYADIIKRQMPKMNLKHILCEERECERCGKYEWRII